MADKKEEPKLTLPTGHPSAGYTSPDLSYHEGTGTIPDDEINWHEDRNAAQQDDAAAVAEAEHKVATEEQAAAEKTAAGPAPAPKAAATKA